jgi:hypothetical protein
LTIYLRASAVAFPHYAFLSNLARSKNKVESEAQLLAEQQRTSDFFV